ncbi:LOW QUALITY PROTEIN: hypothetical protein MARPO_0134s0036 [Marchantia polymorpha]|uniref:Uncharacterized protein n=1 Tax=Marchantia polymorpha TaxID=3197 RepID=A0A2R6W7J4_MARPO|nr:LOW QUALITY PROTEIN: hypothetical protein MARPO_0134s0036 [Marchantia polymorpha]|eukprot:PTQ29825.1 LOW QUALITY PROTEIN: hypothetical protein MARPO_0134s0036 [Marchantia polymorpha]
MGPALGAAPAEGFVADLRHERLLDVVQAIEAQVQQLQRRLAPREGREGSERQRQHHLAREAEQLRHAQLHRHGIVPEAQHQKTRRPELLQMQRQHPAPPHALHHGPGRRHAPSPSQNTYRH